jgi:hypothetical protein
LLKTYCQAKCELEFLERHLEKALEYAEKDLKDAQTEWEEAQKRLNEARRIFNEFGYALPLGFYTAPCPTFITLGLLPPLLLYSNL